MFPSDAPACIAIFWPSPVLVGGVAGEVIGPRRKARTMSGSHSKPPVAITTPRRATHVVLARRRAARCPPRRCGRRPARAVGPGPEHRLDAPVEAAPQQRADQGLTHAPLVLAGPLGQQLTVDDAGAAAHGCLGQVHRQRHPVVQHERRPLAQLGVREQLALEGPPAAGLPAGMLGVVVGIALDQAPVDRRLRLEPVDQHRGRCRPGRRPVRGRSGRG